MSLKFTRTEGACLSSHNCLPWEIKRCVLIFFPASCITWVNYMRFITNIHNFSKFSKIVQSSIKIFAAWRRQCPFNKRFFQKVSQQMYSSCQQHLKLGQFSQQNTPVEQLFCRTAPWVFLEFQNFQTVNAYQKSPQQEKLVQNFFKIGWQIQQGH